MKYKYEFLLHCWGGGPQELGKEFEAKIKYQWFESAQERDKEKERIKQLIDSSCTNKGLAFSEHEGYLTRHRFIIKSLVLEPKKKEFHWIVNDLGFGFFEEDGLGNNEQDYMIDWKWGICPPDGVNLNDCILLNTSLIIEEPNER
jgi:hypothetical protein